MGWSGWFPYHYTHVVTWASEIDHITHHVTLIEQSSHTIAGLTLDTVYTITVTASNQCGDGPEYKTSVSFKAGSTSKVYNFITINILLAIRVNCQLWSSYSCFIH